jgi:WD40 repeat protein
MSGVFVAGGTMKPGTLTYIERNADSELFNAVLAGQYCSVLTTRQMGKSSLMARTAARLRDHGISCATIDLQGKSGQPEQWYYGFLKQLADGLGLSFDLARWWKEQELLPPAQRVTDFFADVVLKQIAGPVVVFIDEVDWMIRLPFSDEFFAAIRSCYNRRATEPAFERLTFVLLGSASPAQLIKDATRTPFNIGRGIELTDFTPAEASPLAQWLGDNGDRILARILYWTDGHPYLTQMLCEKTLESAPDSRPPDAAVDSVVQEKLLSTGARQEENNLKFVADRLTQGTRNLRRVLRTYHDVLRGKPIRDVPASPVHTSLRLSGSVKSNADRLLTVRNRVYQTVFNEAWVREKTPLDLRLVLAEGSVAVLLAMFAVWYRYVFPQAYIQTLQTANKDTEVAYTAYDHLNQPFHRTQANELLAQFFERRNDRDYAIMIRARSGDLVGLSELIGSDYPGLQRSFRYPGQISVVAFSPSGALIAAGDWDNTARLFAPATGRELARNPTPGYSIWDATFSPNGRSVAAGSNEGMVLEAATARELARFDAGGLIASVVFSPDGKFVATGAGGGAQLFDIRTKRETLRLEHGDTVTGVAISPDGELLATGSGSTDAGKARIFELATRHETFKFSYDAKVTGVAFSPDSNLLAVASSDGIVRLIALRTGREVRRLLQPALIESVRFSPDGKLIATGSDDYTARVFDFATGREISRVACQGAVLRTAFSPDDKQIAAACWDGTVRLLRPFTGRAPPPRAEPSSGNPAVGSFFEEYGVDSPDKTLLVMETANWLHLYQRNHNQLIPVANRHLPVLWPRSVRFLSDPHCPRCVQVDRDVPENARKTEIVNFDAHPAPSIHGTPEQLVAEWGAKLALKFDSRGRLVPTTPPLRSAESPAPEFPESGHNRPK